MAGSVLKLFHPLVAKWFGASMGVPTDLQQQAWPVIASGRNLLLSAPTGSGERLTSFQALKGVLSMNESAAFRQRRLLRMSCRWTASSL